MLVAALLAVQCSLAQAAPPGQTAMQRAIGQCVASMVASTVVGALIGQMAGGNAGRGAAIGAATGVGTCAVLMQLASAQDKARVAEAERQAVMANMSRTDTFRTREGRSAQVTTQVRPVSRPAPKPAPRPAAAPGPSTPSAEPALCREAVQTVSVDGAAATAGKQLWCRAPNGDWAPVDI